MGRPREIVGDSKVKTINVSANTLNVFLAILPHNESYSGWVNEKMEEEILKSKRNKAISTATSNLSAIGQMTVNTNNSNTFNPQMAFDYQDRLIDYAKYNRDLEYINKAIPRTKNHLKLLESRQWTIEAEIKQEKRDYRLYKSTSEYKNKQGIIEQIFKEQEQEQCEPQEDGDEVIS